MEREVPETRLVSELMKMMPATHRFCTEKRKYRSDPRSPPFPSSLSALLRWHPSALTSRGWLLCQESGSRGVFEADFLSVLCGCQEECERRAVSIVTAVRTWTAREALPRLPGTGAPLAAVVRVPAVGG